MSWNEGRVTCSQLRNYQNTYRPVTGFVDGWKHETTRNRNQKGGSTHYRFFRRCPETRVDVSSFLLGLRMGIYINLSLIALIFHMIYSANLTLDLIIT